MPVAPSGLVPAVVEGEKVAHLRGFGTARPGGNAPTATTPFGIGPLPKPFTALAVMQFVEVGRGELDAPVTASLQRAATSTGLSVGQVSGW